MAEKRITLIVYGDVQVVGFRREVERIAKQLGIVGCIKNLKDGTVKVIAEGEEDILRAFINEMNIDRKEDLKQFVPGIRVDDIRKSWEEKTGGFRDFRIVFDEESKSPDEEDAERWEKGFMILKTLAEATSQMPTELRSFRRGVETRFDIVDTKYSLISILAGATVISITITSVFGALVLSRIMETTPAVFAYVAIPYVVLWCGVVVLFIHRRVRMKKIVELAKEQTPGLDKQRD